MREPLHTLTCAGAACHHVVELAGGAGLVLQARLGLPAALALWGTLLPAWFREASRREGGRDDVLAFAAGAALANAALHFTLWPWRLRRGLPVLTDAEGFPPSYLPWYNTLLYAWAASAVGALLLETGPRGRRRALLGFLLAIPLRREAKYHYGWIQEQARRRPAWWNRAFQGGSPAR